MMGPIPPVVELRPFKHMLSPEQRVPKQPCEVSSIQLRRADQEVFEKTFPHASISKFQRPSRSYAWHSFLEKSTGLVHEASLAASRTVLPSRGASTVLLRIVLRETACNCTANGTEETGDSSASF